MANILKPVKVKRTAFTFHLNPSDTKQYIHDCVNTGSDSDLFQDPHIETAFYDEGMEAAGAIDEAITACHLAPTKGNQQLIGDRVSEGVLWLHKYSDKVEVIANDEANRTTREEAATNITLSYLTVQKLKSFKKGNPETPEVTATNVGSGKIDVQIVNGAAYQPTQTTYIVVEARMGAVISILRGQLEIKMRETGHIIVKTAARKGKYTHFTGLIPGVEYEVYAYAQNGKQQVSQLSQPAIVKG